MPSPYLSEIRMFASGIVPNGWAVCNGQVLNISGNPALFALLGNAYGGDGKTTYALPNLKGRVPMHRGTTMSRGASGGEQAHQLTLGEIPLHKHQAMASSNQPDSNTPDNNFWAVNPGFTPYGEEQDNPMSPGALGATGTDTPHNNMAPYLALNICIATVGLYPDPKSKNLGDEYIGEARMFAGTVIPGGWLPCDGQSLNAGDYTALFSFIGDIYGASGFVFNLPNLQDAAAVGSGNGKGLTPYLPGENGGVTTVLLAEKEIPVHTHAANARQVGTKGEPDGLVWANPSGVRPPPDFYASAVGTPQPMHDKAIGANGGGQPHNNLMPYTVVVFCIATAGLTP